MSDLFDIQNEVSQLECEEFLEMMNIRLAIGPFFAIHSSQELVVNPQVSQSWSGVSSTFFALKYSAFTATSWNCLILRRYSDDYYYRLEISKLDNKLFLRCEWQHLYVA